MRSSEKCAGKSEVERLRFCIEIHPLQIFVHHFTHRLVFAGSVKRLKARSFNEENSSFEQIGLVSKKS